MVDTIDGATESTYTLTQVDVGSVIRVTASYTDGQGTVESVPIFNRNTAKYIFPFCS